VINGFDRQINRNAIFRISDLKSEIEKVWYSTPKKACENLDFIIIKGGLTKY